MKEQLQELQEAVARRDAMIEKLKVQLTKCLETMAAMATPKNEGTTQTDSPVTPDRYK